MTTSPSPPRLNTVGRIAARLRVAIHRVEYVVHRKQIQPSAYAGRLRLFNEAAVARIRHELNAIDARRAQRGGGR